MDLPDDIEDVDWRKIEAATDQQQEATEPLDLSTKPGLVASLQTTLEESSFQHRVIKPRLLTPAYNEETLREAVQKVKERSMSQYTASQVYGIPRTTIQYRISGAFKSKGTKGPFTVFSVEEEKDIEKWLQDMERKGFPITQSSLKYKIGSYLETFPRSTPFTNNIPGQSWVQGFLRRHPSLKLRTPESVTAASSRVSPKDIRNWFRSVYAYLLDNNLTDVLKDPTRILNGDESGFSLNPVPKNVIGSSGKKNVSFVETTSSKTNITVLFSFTADGGVIPPDVILPQKRFSREILRSFPAEWGLGSSDNGWMDTRNFVMYVKKVLYPTLLKRGIKFPVIFFVDGHSSHTALEAADACAKLGIVLIALYPNATRILQPADVAIFGPLKSSWAKVLEVWRLQNPGEPVKLTNFGSLLEKAMGQSFKQSTIVNGFATCGLYPFNADAPDYTKCLATSTEDHGVEESSDGNRLSDEQFVHDVLDVPDNSIGDFNMETNTEAAAITNSAAIQVLVPQTAMNKAIEMLGTETLQHILTSDDETLSEKDKALSYIYKHILSLAKPDLVLFDAVNLNEEVAGAVDAPSSIEIFENPDEMESKRPVEEFIEPNIGTLRDFLQVPKTPQRAKKHRNYKNQSYAVLTAGERLNMLSQQEESKKEAIRMREEIKQERARKREELEEAKKSKREITLKRKLDKENEMKRKEETKKLRMEERRMKKEEKQKKEEKKRQNKTKKRKDNENCEIEEENRGPEEEKFESYHDDSGIRDIVFDF